MYEQILKAHQRNVRTNCAGIFAFILPVFLLAAAVFSSGCSVYNNVTTYFNTFYNAQHVFDLAVAEVNKSPQKDRDTNYFARYNVTPAVAGKFDSVIVKCSKVIQFHADSRYVDDALLMIAESYAYQGDAESAVKKFQELLTNFPESDLRFEAKLWFAKTEYFDKKYDEAVTIAREAAADAAEAGEDDIFIEATMLQAQVSFDRKDYDAAAEFYQKAIDADGDKSLRAIAAYQLGTIYEAQEKFDRAANAYLSVRNYSPDQNLRFKASTRYAVMTSRLGDHEIALRLLDDLKYDAVKPEEKATLDFEIAKTYTAMDDTAQAFEFYRYMDTVYRNTAALERSFYERGHLFETKYNDLESALEYYKRTQNTNANTEEGLKGKQKYSIFNHYFTVLKSIAKYDSMLHPELYKKAITDSTDSLGIARGDSTGGSGRDTLMIAHRDASNGDTLEKGEIPDNGLLRSRPGGDAGRNDDTSGQEPAEEPADDSGEKVFLPPEGAPTDPREELVTDAEAADAGAGDEEDDEPIERDQLFPIRHQADDEVPKGRRVRNQVAVPDTEGGIIAVPAKQKNAKAGSGQKPAFTPDSLRKLILRNQFELAGIFYLELGLPDSAETLYRQIIDDSLETPFRPAAMYSLAELRRSLRDTAAAESLHTIVMDRYPRTEYAKKVKALRNMDTTAFVEPRLRLYYAAVESLQAGNIEVALYELHQLHADTSDTSAVAARSMYLTGWIYENERVHNDSAAAVYKELIRRFPASEFAASATPKVAVKENPESLSQYVKIKEIQPIQKPEKSRQKDPAKGEGERGSSQPGDEDDEIETDEEKIRSRMPNRDVEEDELDEEDIQEEEDSGDQ